jgi:DNA primase
MARIPDEEIPRLKREVALERLCAGYGIELKPQGKDLIGRCPFHDDKTPSFIVTPSKNLWHCLGACGCGGSNIDFLMKKEGTDFRGAVALLQKQDQGGAVTPIIRTRQGTERKMLVEPGQELEDAALLSRVVDFYHTSFMNHPTGMQYLQQRGCFHPEAVTKFKLGLANRTLGYRVPDTLKEGKRLKEKLQRLGVLRDSGHEHLNGCVVFPIHNTQGQPVELYGRRITKVMPDACPHLYLPGPHAGVWNQAGIAGERQWILCEAALDALSLWCHGFRQVTWSYGTNGFSPDHWALLREARPDRIVIAYDNDDAGNKAANELAQQLEPEGIEAWRMELPPRNDINDVVRSTKDPKAELASLLAGAHRLLPPGLRPVPARKVIAFAAAPEPPPVPLAAPAANSPETTPEDAPRFQMQADGQQAEMSWGERHYRVRGLSNNTSFDQLKVNVRLQYRGKFHIDNLDLYQARQRTTFIAQGHQVTGVDKGMMEGDLTQLIGHLEKHQEGKLLAQLQPVDVGPVMTPEEETAALKLLKEPKLFERILADFATAGTVGEDMNKLVGYLIAVSRKLDKPLSGMIVARSAAGKSSLLNAILDFVPDEDKEVLTSMTGQALYYMEENALKNKVLAVMEDEGSTQATYPLKILQSEKKLVLAVTVRDPDGGMPQTKTKTVEGPVAEFMTSTRSELDYELENRHIILSVDEDREQTRRIHAAQREAHTLAGLLRRLDREAVMKTHHNAQRLLRPLRVVNPYAQELRFADDRLRLRRDHEKYLGLIDTVAFLRQYQKQVRSCDHRGRPVQYIEVDPEDLRLAHGLAAQVFGRSLDELAPPTRSFLLALHRMVNDLARERKLEKDQVRFTRREARERLKWSVTQVREHLSKLVDLEYVLCHRVPGLAARQNYELLYDGEGKEGAPFLLGLRDISQINVGSNGADVGRNGHSVGPLSVENRPDVGLLSEPVLEEEPSLY